MTLSKKLNVFLKNNYEEIKTMTAKICKNRQHTEELAHYVISCFVEHPKAISLVERGEAMKFMSGMIHRSYHSHTSPYHKIYRKNNIIMEPLGGIDDLSLIPSPSDEPYDTETDITITHIETILEEMAADNIDRWYKSVLFRMWVETPNYSKLSKKTGIPRTSISTAVQECREYILKRLKDYGDIN